ncbi:sensor histidine kinase [Cohnella silvisoli]|uniref:histidine kinase n=1 Tax=Cohnella silvisoli TaxID=2873699 RepID=A0ABV1KXN7_9BACL|nr:ATP-binding protein [Cohnella silvisoli]MCD9024164.1 hypothetical protein [Cohnella silvisoli]
MKFGSLVKILIYLFIPIQLWFVYIMASYAYIGVDLKKTNNEWTVIRVDGKVKSGLNLGDIILKVNEEDVNQFSSVIRWKTLEQAETILASRNGVEFKIDTNNFKKISLSDTLGLSGQVFSLFVAALLCKWMPSSRSAQHLSFLFFNIGVTFMSLGASIRGDLLGKSLIGTCLMLLPIVLLHFFIIFFKEKCGLNLPYRFLRYLFAIVPLTFLVYWLWIITNATYYIYVATSMIMVPFFILGVFLNLIFLFYIFIRYRKSNKNTSILIKMIWVSLILSFTPLICFSFIPRILYGYYWVDSFYSSWAVLFFPLSFTYLLASKKLYDIDLVVRRFTLTSALSLFPSSVIVGVISLLYPEESDASRLFISFILCVVLLSLILYSLEYFTTSLERVMFPRKYRLQESLKKIAKKLGLISSFRELKDIILIDIIRTLQVFGGAIVFRYKDSEEVISEGDIDANEVERLAASDVLEHPSYTRYELVHNEEYTCYLILTRKKTNTHLGFEETQWLNLIISYLAVSLENIHLIRKLTMKLEQLAAHIPQEGVSADFAWFRKLMFELQEKERVRIANDLHDTTMQDLFFLKRRCTSLMEKYDFNPEDLAQMNGIIDYIDIINMNLRQSCFELHPFLLQEIGLIRTIEKLVELEAVAADFKIEFQSARAYFIEACDMETKRHLFRVVQELLNNAKKHSQASIIKLEISASASRLVLSYEDDGVGFDTGDTVLREIGASRTGVEYMKSRILSLNGHFELSSGKGQGMKFMAAFPMKEGRTA